ncbi:arginine N-succinyltransferase [Shewanella litorisediminis]|uniref:Arginine N-succinyltransferase n=1 Tax=Shewanella litorisediminis TaxID=1173586 RepID=A0ABX7G4T0_9GAMM|nr:arginine N-succinyltransferase [Shewanella litorisediminis]MCL2917875.1 arginine N-succinyltransferase [Shewanella litorisediminis]QRH02311.1 arginine N-succinyltransferase [Shewanella litorisediminis]
MNTRTNADKRGFSGAQVLLIILAVILLTAVASFLIIRTYIFPSPFTPVTLSAKEEKQLDAKLDTLGWDIQRSSNSARQGADNRGSSDLTPEPYRERDGDRQVTFSEKEVNAMIGRSPEFAERLAIDFSDNLASAKLLVPIPRDFPIMAGETLRVNAGLDIHLDQRRRPVVALVGVSLMGVPLPNAWLGNMKQVNLVSEFGDSGFWNAFADGVEDVQIREGELYIRLRP